MIETRLDAVTRDCGVGPVAFAGQACVQAS